MSAIPDWLIQDTFVLPKEKKIRDKLVVAESKLESLQKEKEQLEQQITDESLLKHLLYETTAVPLNRNKKGLNLNELLQCKCPQTL